MPLLLVCNTDSLIKFTYQGSQVGIAPVSAGTCPLSGTLTGTVSWNTTPAINNFIDNKNVVLQLDFSATGFDSLGQAPSGTASFTIKGNTSNTTCNDVKPVRKTNNASGTTTQISKTKPYPVIAWADSLIATIDNTIQTSTFAE